MPACAGAGCTRANGTGADGCPCADGRSDCCSPGSRRHPRLYAASREGQPGPRQHHAEDRNRRHDGHAPGHQQRSGRSQPVGQRHSRDPVPRRVAGFDLERRLSRAQRARQRAVPHQRHHPSRRRVWLRAVPRNELHRQDGTPHRCPTGAIRTAQHRDPRHHVEGFHHQSEQRVGRCLWRQQRHDHADVRIWREGRQHRVFLRRPRIPEFSRPRKPDRERHRAPRFQHARRLLRLHLDFPRRVDAHQHDHRRPDHQISDPDQSGPAGVSGSVSDLWRPRRRRRFRQDQRGAIREERLWRARLAEVARRHRHAARLLLPIQQPAVRSRHLRRYPLQRSRLEHRPHLVHERAAGGQRLQGQRCAHSPVRIQFERRAGHCPHHRDGGTLLRRRRQRHRRPVQFYRSEHQDRLSRRRLPAGRVADHAEPDAQLGRALRPDVAIRRQAPAQPARQFRLHTHAGHHAALGLCAVLYAAAPDPRSSGERGAVRGHDGRAAVERTEPDPAGAVASGRCRHQSSSCCLRVLRPRRAQS